MPPPGRRTGPEPAAGDDPRAPEAALPDFEPAAPDDDPAPSDWRDGIEPEAPWFLPDDLAEDGAGDPADIPTGRSGDWLRPWLEAAGSAEVLARLIPAAEALARLETRLTTDPRLGGAVLRLAHEEAADALWLAGDPGARDRLDLYAHGVRAAEAPRDQLALWALTRLRRAGRAPAPVERDPHGLREYLGLVRRAETPEDAVLFPRPQGAELDAGLAEWCRMAERTRALHPLLRAAILHRAWRFLGLSGPEDPVTPGVIAAEIAGGPPLGFAPWAGAVRRLRTLARSGPPAMRLAAGIEAFGAGARQASLTL